MVPQGAERVTEAQSLATELVHPPEGRQPQSSQRTVRILYAFGGPENSPGGVEECAEEIGRELGRAVVVHIHDIVNGEHQDLASDSKFRKIINN